MRHNSLEIKVYNVICLALYQLCDEMRFNNGNL